MKPIQLYPMDKCQKYHSSHIINWTIKRITKQADIKSAFLTEDYPGTFYIKYEQETFKMEKFYMA